VPQDQSTPDPPSQPGKIDDVKLLARRMINVSSSSVEGRAGVTNPEVVESFSQLGKMLLILLLVIEIGSGELDHNRLLQ